MQSRLDQPNGMAPFIARPNILETLVPDGGISGALFRATDWARTAVGAPEGWPESLKAAVGIVFHSRHPMFIWWGEELVQFYNDAYLPSFGVGKHPKAMGQPGRECWPEIWPIIGPQIEGVRKHAKATWHENQLVPIFRNGTIEDVYWTYGYSPILNLDGSVGGVLVVCTETTGRVLVEKKLAESHRQAEQARQELHSFLMQVPVGVARLEGPEHVFRFVNPAYMQLLFPGRKDSDLLGKPVRLAVPEVAEQGFIQVLDSVYATGKSYSGSKMRLVLSQADGAEKEFFVNFTYQAQRDHRDNITGIQAVLYEVTDQVNEEKEIKTLAQHLRDAIVSRDAFLGIASHELKTPLTSLKLQGQMTKRIFDRQGAGNVPPEKIAKFIDTTLVQTDRLSRLIDDMLDISRISTGKLTMNIVDVDLSTLARETFERFAPQLAGAGCEVIEHIAPGVHARLDAFRTEQVIANLITNVMKYAPGRPVHVTVEENQTQVRLSVRDEGPGIGAEDQLKVFDRFERGSASSGVSGLGLGLYVSRQIVESHGGNLKVISGPGKGAEFVVDFPRVACA